MASISEEDQILDALTGPWNKDAYTRYLQEVYGYTGLAGDEIDMNRGSFFMVPNQRQGYIAHIYCFHDLEDKKRWLGSELDDGDNEVLLNPRGGRHLVALLQEIDDELNVQEPRE